MRPIMENSAQDHEAAAQWLARRDSGKWLPEDDAQLDAWLKASTGHRVAFIRLETAWREANRVKILGAGAARGSVPPRVQSDVGRVAADRLPNTARRMALAAGILLALASGIAWYVLPARSAYETPVGGLASVPIADGSKVTLNTDSEIRVRVTDTERLVDLRRGEAFFEVAQDLKRPFIVHAGDRRVIAVGTAFSVLRQAGQLRVIVTEGRVRIEDGAVKQQPPIQLSAGALARTGNDGVLVQEKPVPEVQEYLSWRSGFVTFRETPLAEAAAELNRYNTRKLVVDDAALAAIHIGGTFRSTNIDAFVRLLEQGYPIRSEAHADRIVLTRRSD